MTELNNIKTIVMGRVRAIHVFQMFLTTTALSVVAFVVSLWGVGREVWINRVIQNEPSISLVHLNLADISAFVHFYISAFLDTRFVVQVLVVLSVMALAWFVYGAVRTIVASLGVMGRSGRHTFA